ncbi:hypothetical protein ACFOOP_03755 [Marinicaulis aureus]|uniref:Uncharacterized protein n=1 Tax=Hyphococcus aureus TaxID=2666033 RepID=A0ABW1KWW6_9PROT
MDIASLRKEITEIQEKALPQANLREDHHEKLFEVFRQIDSEIGRCTPENETENETRLTGLIEAQTIVLRTAASLPARCLRDLLYKLAMWRWDTADLEQPMEDLNRADAMAYSAFLDIVKMLGEHDVLKGFDKANLR